MYVKKMEGKPGVEFDEYDIIFLNKYFNLYKFGE